MTQTTKNLVKKQVEQQVKTRVSRAIEHRVENTAVLKVKDTVTAKASVLAAKADKKLETARKIRRVIAKIVAAVGMVLAVYHKLKRLYSFIPRLKNANDKVAAMTGVDIASKIIPQNK